MRSQPWRPVQRRGGSYSPSSTLLGAYLASVLSREDAFGGDRRRLAHRARPWAREPPREVARSGMTKVMTMASMTARAARNRVHVALGDGV